MCPINRQAEPCEDEGRLQMDVPCVPSTERQSHVKTILIFRWMCPCPIDTRHRQSCEDPHLHRWMPFVLINRKAEPCEDEGRPVHSCAFVPIDGRKAEPCEVIIIFTDGCVCVDGDKAEPCEDEGHLPDGCALCPINRKAELRR